MEEEIRYGGESQKNVSDKFLDLIFDTLQTLRQREFMMKMGFDSLIEYMRMFNFKEKNINYLKVENMNLMIADFEIILSDIEVIVNDEKIKSMNEHLDDIKKLISKGYKSKTEGQLFAFKEIYDQRNKGVRYMKLHPLFDILVEKLSGLRRELNLNLKSILYTQKKLKENPKEIY